ncbi:hypothetical protein [Candidatus Amarobacter glycogenicus]|uniref:hypothetical protein n=1 Tax=Candidatus Amarobacter glycogenicus TaxID=3140699 RepID=UPI0031CC862B
MEQPMPNTKPTHHCHFGASGDLTRRNLIPAIFGLSPEGRLPAPFRSSVLRAVPEWDTADFPAQLLHGVRAFAPRGRTMSKPGRL